MSAASPSPLAQLVVARLLVEADRRAPRSALRRDLEPLVRHRLGPSEWSALLDETLAELETLKWVSRGRGNATLTDEGTRAALDFLGLADPPAKTSWGSLKKTALVARALGLGGAAAARIGGADGLRAAILKHTYELPLSDAATLAQARDALCWKELGVATDRPFSQRAVVTLLLNRALQGPRELDLDEALRQLPARQVGARRSDAEELRLAVLRRFADGPEEKEAAAVPAMRLEEFAAAVLAAARSSTTGRFGDDKVFIAHLWRALAEELAEQGMDFAGFQRRLVEAHRAHLLRLSRADLVEAMDPADVAASETRYESASFHFVRTTL